MFEQDYIKVYFDGNTFSMKVFPPKGKPDTPIREAEKSAFYYYKKYKNKKFILCMSGGMDSQVMAESFLRAGVPFSASIWKYKKNLNTYDIKSAIKFCEEHSIDYEIEECDLELFYRNNLHFHYGVKYLCDSPQIAVHLHFLEKLSKKSNTALFLPWEPPSFHYNRYSKKIILRVIMHYRYLAYHRFFHLNKIAGTAYFLISRSALLHSFLKLPITKLILNRNISLKYYQAKTIMYRQGGFLSKPLKGKFTGFDKLKTVLMTKYGMDYNKAFRYPLVNFISSPKKQDMYIHPLWENKESDFYSENRNQDRLEMKPKFKEKFNVPLSLQKERQRVFI